MKNVLAIFVKDLKHLFINTVTTIVTLGLIIVPPMYAWLTTLGFWDPYNNTGGLEVAIANEDTGYSSTLIPTQINVGANIVNKLHTNSQFDWVFCSAEEAESGVRSGEFYAGIVIPADFSKDLMSVMSNEETKPTFTYYVNQKKNAIASHVTSTGASVLQAQINQSFAKTVSEVTLVMMGDLSQFFDNDSMTSYGHALLAELKDADIALQACIAEAQGIYGAIQVSQSLLNTSSTVLAGAANLQSDADNLASSTAGSLQNGASALQDGTTQLSGAITSADNSIGTIQNAVNAVYSSAQDDPAIAEQLLGDAATSAQNLSTAYSGIRQSLETAGASAQTIALLDQSIANLNALANELIQAQASVKAIASNAQASHDKVNTEITSARTNIEALNQSFTSDVAAQVQALQNNISAVQGSSEELIALTAAAASSLSEAAGGLASSLDAAQSALMHTINTLNAAQLQLSTASTQLEYALSSGQIDEVRKIIGGNADSLASFIAAPTQMNTHAVYEVPNNGSSMSPFYSSLALWVGSIFLIALTNVNVSKDAKSKLSNPKAWQLYLGRYGVFLFVALMQALVLFIGNVFFLGIQCEYPGWYLLSLIICALVFSNLVYTLNISFGNIGKAIAIILLVMQLAGTGGIMPIQTSAPIFQAIYPWLPFTHALTALSSSMSGIYGAQLAVNLGLLLAFLVPSLLLGLVFRNPMIKANDFITKKLDETKLI